MELVGHSLTYLLTLCATQRFRLEKKQEQLLAEEEDTAITILKMQNKSQVFAAPGVISIFWSIYRTSLDDKLEKNRLRSNLLSPL